MGTTRFSGIYVAIVTPFEEDNSIDLGAFRWLVASLADSGVDGLLVSGTTGEWPSLRLEERVRLAEAAIEASDGSLSILVGVMSGSAMDTIEYASTFRNVDVDAVVATPPLYFRPGHPSELADYFIRIAEAADKPLMIYTIPSHVGYNIPVEAVRIAAEKSDLVKGIKATVDDLHFLHALVNEVKAVRSDFSVLAGYGEYMLDALASGADGAVDAIANIVPGLTVSIRDFWREGKYREAISVHKATAMLASSMRGVKPIQSLVKGLLSLLGAPISVKVRPPLSPLAESVVEKFRDLLCSKYRPYLLQRLSC